MAGHGMHHYRASCSWSGSTGAGYANYDRSHQAGAEPARAALSLSADPAFRGDPALLNPEQLVVIAAASCQLLSFLAVAARAGLDVRRYVDDAQAEMPEDETPVRIKAIRLRPRIELAGNPSRELVLGLVQQAHEQCYVASSLNTAVSVEPELVFV
jgi:organic hydroperoxide reductase OsmC/OhrA